MVDEGPCCRKSICINYFQVVRGSSGDCHIISHLLPLVCSPVDTLGCCRVHDFAPKEQHPPGAQGANFFSNETKTSCDVAPDRGLTDSYVCIVNEGCLMTSVLVLQSPQKAMRTMLNPC